MKKLPFKYWCVLHKFAGITTLTFHSVTMSKTQCACFFLPRNTWGVCICVCSFSTHWPWPIFHPLPLVGGRTTETRPKRCRTLVCPPSPVAREDLSLHEVAVSLTPPVDCQGWLSEKFELLTSVGSGDLCTKKAAWISQSCSLRSMVPRAKKNVSDHPHCLLTGRHRQGHASANGWKETTSV